MVAPTNLNMRICTVCLCMDETCKSSVSHTRRLGLLRCAISSYISFAKRKIYPTHFYGRSVVPISATVLGTWRSYKFAQGVLPKGRKNKCGAASVRRGMRYHDITAAPLFLTNYSIPSSERPKPARVVGTEFPWYKFGLGRTAYLPFELATVVELPFPVPPGAQVFYLHYTTPPKRPQLRRHPSAWHERSLLSFPQLPLMRLARFSNVTSSMPGSQLACVL